MEAFVSRITRNLITSVLAALCLAAQPLSAADVRVTTWNLDWFPNGTPKEATPAEQEGRIRAAADVLRPLNPDIILLQEIKDYDAAQKLADTIQPGAYQIAICSAFKERNGVGRQQVAILGKQPAQAAWAETWKSMEGVDPPRGFSFAWYKINGVDLGVYCVHLKSNLVMHGDKAAEGAKNVRKREVAAQQLLDHINSVVAPKMPTVRTFLIGGDFNTNPDEFVNEKTLTTLEQGGFQSCMAGLAAPLRVTHPRSHGYPDTTFDYFFAKGVTVSKPQITRSDASDHLPVTCTLKLGAGSTASATSVSQPSNVETAPATPVAQPTAPVAESVTLAKAISIPIQSGSTVLPPGTRLQVVSRDTSNVRIKYMNAMYEIPISATDLR